MISIVMVGLQHQTTNSRTWQARHHLQLQRLQEHLNHSAWTCWMLCKGQTQSLKFIHSLVTVGWRIVAVSAGLENPLLYSCNWRVQSYLDWATQSTLLSLKKEVCNSISTDLLPSTTSCMYQATRHLH